MLALNVSQTDKGRHGWDKGKALAVGFLANPQHAARLISRDLFRQHQKVDGDVH